jgi:hypothetical protein
MEWLRIFQREQEAKITRFVGPNFGRFNRIGRCAWWYERHVD